MRTSALFDKGELPNVNNKSLTVCHSDHPDQKGFVSRRNISKANRLQQDVIEYSEQNQLTSSIILSII